VSLFVGPSEAQPGTFTWQVCNNTEIPAMLAIIYRLVRMIAVLW